MKLLSISEIGEDTGSAQVIEDISRTRSRASTTEIVLVPRPSDNPNDPLRWSNAKKITAFVVVEFFAFLNSWVIGGLSQAFVELSIDFDQPIPKIAGLLSYCILTLGLANLFWVPLAQIFGKRPVFIAASLLFLAGCIWSPLSTSYNSLLASRIVTAFAGGSTEALGAAIVNDLFFLHQRGTMMGWGLILLSSGNSLGPLCAGFIVTGAGWRWFYWICTILSATQVLAVIFLVPETRFDRHSISVEPNSSVPVPNEKAEPTARHWEAMIETNRCVDTIDNGSSTADTPERKTYLQQLNPWSGFSESNARGTIVTAVMTARFPAVIWTIIGYSISLASVVTVNSLNAFVFQKPPYNFSPAINGLVNIPALMGTLFGAFVGGYVTDLYALRVARKHGGVFSPESRLVMLIVPGILVPCGLLMFGFGATQHYPWAVLYVANGFINVGVTAVASIGMVYISDSYLSVSTEALLLVNALKNVVAFGYSYGVTPWIVSAGFEKPFGTVAGIFVAIMISSIPLYFYGQGIRARTVQWKVLVR